MFSIIFNHFQIPDMETHRLDLTDWDATREVVQSLGRIDLLVNNAGTCKIKPFLESTKEDLNR